MPPKFDIVLRAAYKTEGDVGSFEGLGNEEEETDPRVYYCNPADPDFIMKDRFGVCKKEQPMDLAAIVYRIITGRKPPEGLTRKQLKLAS